MIPPGIDNPDVLRRTLEEIENKQIVLNQPIATVDTLAEDADMARVIVKINELSEVLNTVVATLNASAQVNIS